MNKHEPVLLKEVMSYLFFDNQARPAVAKAMVGKYIDATLGAGGYTKAICEKGGEVLGIDMDNSMLEIARKNLENVPLRQGYEGRSWTLVQGNFKDIGRIAKDNGFQEVSGVVYDLGVSNVHFSDERRGFSFKNPEAKLDMRLSSESQSIKASDLLNGLRVDQLRQIFQEVLGRNEAFDLARKIIGRRDIKKFEKVQDLLEAVGGIPLRQKIFMALRIAVNSELDNLRESLPQALELTKANGRVVVVSFHSLEDRIVKNEFNEWKKNGFGKVITEKPVVPGEGELLKNPKSRSAKLRVFEKT
jgi:16S rRNA (cytosine1402-N4)-methyltransferase